MVSPAALCGSGDGGAGKGSWTGGGFAGELPRSPYASRRNASWIVSGAKLRTVTVSKGHVEPGRA